MGEGLATWIMALAAVAVLGVTLFVIKEISLELKAIVLLYFIFACYVVRVELQFKKRASRRGEG